MDPTEGERGRQHTYIFPIELLLLLLFDKNLGKTMGDVLARLDAILDGHDHGTIHLDEIVVQLARARVSLAWQPLQRLDEVHEVRQRS